MKIKTYEAPTEQEAITKVKDELGSTAIILTIKKITPKGIFRFFRRPKVEVTAAADDGIAKKIAGVVDSPPAQLTDKTAQEAPPAKKYTPSSDTLVKDMKISEQEVKIKTLEQMLQANEDMLKSLTQHMEKEEREYKPPRQEAFENPTLQVFHDTLVKNGVTSEIAMALLKDLDTYFDDEETNVSMLVKLVYNRIVRKLGEPEPLKIQDGVLKRVVFVGPTGVGKTTTIAKLASSLILQNNKRVGLVTADTYRIAAVEQLKTYGEILGIDVEVAYNPEDLWSCIQKIRPFNDVVFIDTAGRAHRNKESMNDLRELLAVALDAEIFLVLSCTTKYEDMKAIADIYSEICDYKIILTKIDETANLGVALNLCWETGKKLAYLTNGQNVPDDIKIAEPAIIARALLGSFDD